MLLLIMIVFLLVTIIGLYCCFRISSSYDRQMEEHEKKKVTETEVP